MRTAETIEETKAAKANSEQAPKKVDKRGKHPNSRKNLVAPWPKGFSANPSGKPGYDVAAALARAVIQENKEEIYNGLAKALIAGNGYVFKELADRGWGPMKQKLEVTNADEVLKRLAAGRKRVSEDQK